MKRIFYYVNVYRMLMRLNWIKLLTYRADFISSSIAHTIWASFTIIQMLLLTSKTSHVFGWSRNELLVLAAMYNIIYSFFYLFFSRGFNAFSTTINMGRLDGVLIKPIDSQFILTCITISYTQIIRFIFGFGFLLYMIQVMHIALTPLLVLGFVILVISSVMLVYSCWMLVMTLTIWFPKLSNLNDLLYQINQISKFPQEIYRGASVYLLFVLFPLTVIVTTPTKQLLQKIFAGDVLWYVACVLVLFVISRNFWKFALRYYTSASS